MRSDKDHVFGNLVEEAGCELFCDTRSNEWNKENNENMSRNHSFELKIDSKNEEGNNLQDSPVLCTEKKVMACELSEVVVCSVVKDICVDVSVPMMQVKFLLNEDKDSVKVNVNSLESKSAEDTKFDEGFVGVQDSTKLDQGNLIVTGEEVEDDYEVGFDKSPPSDVVAKSRSDSMEVLTLRDIISMEDSQKPLINNNNGLDECVDRETEQEKTEELKADNLRCLSFGAKEADNPLLNNVLEDITDHHHLYSSNLQNGFGETSFSQADSSLAHITESEPIAFSGSLSAQSDESNVSARSFAFPILQSEWNSSPVRMVEDKERKLRRHKGWRHYSFLLCCRF